MNLSHNYPPINASVAAIVLFQIAALFARSALQAELQAAGYDHTVAKHLSYLVVPAVEVILFWPILRANKTALLSLCATPFSWLRMLVFSVALGVCARLSYWGAIIAHAAFNWFGLAESGLGNTAVFWFACPAPLTLGLAILVMAALTPIGEEIINRGLLLGALVHRGKTISIILSSLLFSVLHDTASIGPAFLFGLLLARQTLVSGSILPAIISHATFNLLAIVDWSCLHGSWNPVSPTTNTRIIGLFAIALCIAAFLLAFRLSSSVKAGTGLRSRP